MHVNTSDYNRIEIKLLIVELRHLDYSTVELNLHVTDRITWNQILRSKHARDFSRGP